jgi:Cdc6-like AAA superfamily ATPase
MMYVTNSKKLRNREIEKLSVITQWSIWDATEKHGLPENYLVTPLATRLLDLLSEHTANFIVVTGMQGIGKSALHRWLRDELVKKGINVIALRWETVQSIDELFTKYHRSVEAYEGFRKHAVEQGLFLKEDIGDESKKSLIHAPITSEYVGQQFVSYFFKSQERRDLYRDFCDLTKKRTVLIDSQDYAKEDLVQSAQHLFDIQEWWRATLRREGTFDFNLIVFWQQEIWKDDHFFKGKFVVEEIQPIEPSLLAANFIEYFKSPSPFTKSALELTASMSKGVFRRFKRNIRRIIHEYTTSGRTDKIKESDVSEWLPKEEIFKQEFEAMTIQFPKSSRLRGLAIDVLEHLRMHGETRQGEMIMKYFSRCGSPSADCAKVMKKLEEAGYIAKRKGNREEGEDYKEHYVRIAK